MSNALEGVLQVVASALLLPVLLLLVLGLAATLLIVGAFLREALDRGPQLALWRAVRDDGVAALRARPVPELPRLARPLLANGLELLDGVAGEVLLDRRLADTEEALARRVEPAALLAKVGPMLGLAGTLIPLGPALVGLQGGDLGALGSNLAVAFTATVAGLAIAGPCFAVATVRKRWYARDVRALEQLAAALAAGTGRSGVTSSAPEVVLTADAP